ncbi:hypothetical protein AB0O07_26160 [Streptomyces sp. NPDC093085]|uniref:hypothetical protein n=1 Tax=Streptomyces sp. NPDC093085 TaxID=3155068 RepID=UPI00341F11FC
MGGDGFAYWYQGVWDPVRMDFLVRDLDAAGVWLRNPSTGLISSITNGPDSWGEQVTVSRDELIEVAGLRATGEVNFQFWLDGDTDVFTRVRRLPGGGAVIEFGLDGMVEAEREHVIRAVDAAMRRFPGECLGLVVDRTGATEEEDWDRIVLDPSTRFEARPRVRVWRREAGSGAG